MGKLIARREPWAAVAGRRRRSRSYELLVMFVGRMRWREAYSKMRPGLHTGGAALVMPNDTCCCASWGSIAIIGTIKGSVKIIQGLSTRGLLKRMRY